VRFAAFVLAAWAGAFAQPGTMKQIVPGVWFREGDQQKFHHSNNIIVEMDDYLIVVDANFPSGAQAVLADVKKVSTKPIRYVIDTHHHQDHAYGNPVFTRAGAITIGYVGMYEEMQRSEPANWLRVSKGRKDVADMGLDAPEPPMLLYTKSPYVMSDSKRRVELHYFGWGHTRGDTFVYLPREKVLCTGDVVPNGPHSDPVDAWIHNWPNEVAAAEKLDVRYVLPAHGGPGGRELLEIERQFLTELYDAVDIAIKQGKKLDQIVTLKDGQPVATTIRLSPRIMEAQVDHEGMRPTRFATQVRDTYEEITQGKPWGEIAAAEK
jgi:cyclase